MATHDTVYLARIEGIGNATGQYVYTSRSAADCPSYLTTSLIRPVIATAPDVSPASISPLSSRVGDSRCTLRLTHTEDADHLLAVPDGSGYAVDGAVVRLTGYLDTGTTLAVTDSSAFSASDLVWIGADEVVVVGSAPTSTTLSVTRAQLGTTAKPVPHSWPGTILWDTWPGVEGRRIVVSRVEASATSSAEEVVIFRGTIGELSHSGGTITMPIHSHFATLMDAYGEQSWTPPQQAVTAGSTGQLELRASDGIVQWVSDTGKASFWHDLYGTMQPAYLRCVREDGYWWVIETSGTSSTSTLGNRKVELVDLPAAAQVVQLGRDDVVIAVDRWTDPDWFVREIGGGERRLRDVGIYYARQPALYEWCGVWEAGDGHNLSTVVGAILGTSLPWPVSLRLLSSELDSDSLDVLNDALPTLELRSPEVAAAYAGAFILPRYDGATIREVVDDLTLPVGCTLVPARDGLVRAINFAQVTIPTVTIGVDDDREQDPSMRRKRASVLREVTYRTEVGSTQSRATYVSEVASVIVRGGRRLDLTVHALAAHLDELEPVATRLLTLYERAVSEVPWEIGEDHPLELNDVIRLDVPVIPGRDGSRGSTVWARTLVLEVGERAGQMQSVKLLILGTEVGAQWAPTATVAAAGYSSGKVYISADDWTTDGLDDLDGFVAGNLVRLSDQYGTDKASALEVTGVGTDGTGPFLTVAHTTAVEGDIVTLADYDDRDASYTWAWLAGEDGGLGAAGDTGFIYS